jgi:hypothetical protein
MAAADRVGPNGEYDGDSRRGLLYSAHRGARRHDDIDLETDELGRDLVEPLVAAFRPAKLDRDGAAVDPGQIAQPLHEGGGVWLPDWSCGRP